MTGRFFGPAGRSEDAEEQHGESRRRPPAPDAELHLRAEISRKLLQHPSHPTGKLNELWLSVLAAINDFLGSFRDSSLRRAHLSARTATCQVPPENKRLKTMDLRNEGNHHVHVKSCEVSTPSWRTLYHFASSIKQGRIWNSRRPRFQDLEPNFTKVQTSENGSAAFTSCT